MRRRAPSKSAARTARRLAQLVRLSWRGSRTCAREGCRAQPNANEPSSASVQAQRCGGHANSCETYRGETANSPGGRRGNCRCPTARSCRGHASSGSHAARRRRASDGRDPHGSRPLFVSKGKRKQKSQVCGPRGPVSTMLFFPYSYALWTATENSRQGASTRSAPRANTLVELRHRVSLCRLPPARSV